MNDVAQEVETLDVGTMAVLARAEIDQQIATAKAYPRSIQKFMRDAESWACLNEESAEECTYAIPRDGKMLEGPSARMAEILVVSWQNCRAGARIVEIGSTMLRAQGYFMDVERNIAVAYEVSRRITNKWGKRYNDDMITTQANAACSIAYRSVVFKGIPQAIWKGIWQKARLTAAGTAQTLEDRRKKAMAYLATMGASEARILETLGVRGIEDVTLDHLATLKAIVNAVRDGEMTVETAFGAEAPAAETPAAEPVKANTKGMDGLAAALGASEPAAGVGAPQEGAGEPAQADLTLGAGK